MNSCGASGWVEKKEFTELLDEEKNPWSKRFIFNDTLSTIQGYLCERKNDGSFSHPNECKAALNDHLLLTAERINCRCFDENPRGFQTWNKDTFSDPLAPTLAPTSGL